MTASSGATYGSEAVRQSQNCVVPHTRSHGCGQLGGLTILRRNTPRRLLQSLMVLAQRLGGFRRCNAPCKDQRIQRDQQIGRNRSASTAIASGLIPSTPADRLPLLPLTRARAITRTAGSHTRLNRSSNRLSGLSIAGTAAFVTTRQTTTLNHDVLLAVLGLQARQRQQEDVFNFFTDTRHSSLTTVARATAAPRA